MPARVSSRLGRALLAASLAGLAVLPAAAQSPSPVASAAPAVFPFDESTALPAIPAPGSITDPAPIGWEHVTIWPDGQTLTVWFWNGAQGCFGLDRLELEDTGAGLRITPYVGMRADATNVRCIASMQLYQTVLELSAPILGGGVSGIDGAQPTTPVGKPIAAGATLSAMEPQPWDRVSVWPDGVTAAVHFTTGDPACYGLGRVDTPVQDEIQVVVLQTGPLAAPGSEQTACSLVAVAAWTPVTLPAPLLVGGAV